MIGLPGGAITSHGAVDADPAARQQAASRSSAVGATASPMRYPSSTTPTSARRANASSASASRTVAERTSDSRSQRPRRGAASSTLGVGQAERVGVGRRHRAIRRGTRWRDSSCLRDLGDARALDLRERLADLGIARILVQRLGRHRERAGAIAVAEAAARAGRELDRGVRALALPAIDDEPAGLDHLASAS